MPDVNFNYETQQEYFGKTKDKELFPTAFDEYVAHDNPHDQRLDYEDQLHVSKELLNECAEELRDILFFKMRNKDKIAKTLDRIENFMEEFK